MKDKTTKKPVSRSARGNFASVKMNGAIGFKIKLQRDYLYIIDQMKDITFIGVPKLGMDYTFRGETRRFAASYQLVEAGKSVAVFVDYERSLKRPLKEWLVAEARQFYEQSGDEFRTVTDAWIYSGYKLRNARTLTQYALHDVSPEVKTAVLDCLREAGGTLTLAEVIELFHNTPPPVVTIATMQMVFFHLLVCELDEKPLSRSTTLALPDTYEVINGIKEV